MATENNPPATPITASTAGDNKKETQNKIFKESYVKLLDTMDDKVTLANLVNVITRSVEIVDVYKGVTGMEKKLMVVKMVTMLIEKYEDDERLKASLVELLNTVGVTVIDTIIYASKGKLAINLKTFKKMCFACLSKK